MDDHVEQTIIARLDRIENYLAQLGAASGYPYAQPAPYAQQQPSRTGGAPPVDPDILAMAQSGRMIQAIKLYRNRTGAPLAIAKATVELASRGF